jgi:hypothetical protein
MTDISLIQRLERDGLTRAQAQIVAALYDAGNRWVDAGELNYETTEGQRIYDRLEDREDSTMKVHVHWLRKARGDEFILGSRYGWTLGAPAIRLCRRLLALANPAPVAEREEENV